MPAERAPNKPDLASMLALESKNNTEAELSMLFAQFGTNATSKRCRNHSEDSAVSFNQCNLRVETISECFKSGKYDYRTKASLFTGHAKSHLLWGGGASKVIAHSSISCQVNVDVPMPSFCF